MKMKMYQNELNKYHKLLNLDSGVQFVPYDVVKVYLDTILHHIMTQIRNIQRALAFWALSGSGGSRKGGARPRNAGVRGPAQDEAPDRINVMQSKIDELLHTVTHITNCSSEFQLKFIAALHQSRTYDLTLDGVDIQTTATAVSNSIWNTKPRKHLACLIHILNHSIHFNRTDHGNQKRKQNEVTSPVQPLPHPVDLQSASIRSHLQYLHEVIDRAHTDMYI